MAGRKNLVAVGEDAPTPEMHDLRRDPDDQAEESLPAESDAWDEDWDEDQAATARKGGWVAPLLAMLAIAAWTAFFGFAHQADILDGLAPVEGVNLVTAWSVPVLLVVALWLLAMRTSRREASRFADAAATLSNESALLEQRLTSVNRELSLAREFLAAQSRDLESLGRVAGDRISQNADRLAGLILENGEQVKTIATVSDTALENMSRLRDELPVIANSARDVASQIGNAGNTAHGQIDELSAGFKRLNEFGEISTSQVNALTAQVDQALSEFTVRLEQLDTQASARFAALKGNSEEFRSELDSREVDALAAIRRRAATLQEELSTARSELDAQEQAALSALRERIMTVSDDVTRIAGDLRQGEADALTAWEDAIERLEQTMRAAVQKVSEIDAGALDNTRKRLAALNELAAKMDNRMASRMQMFEEEVAQREKEAEEREAAALASLDQRLQAFDATIVERQEEQLAHVAGLAERGEALSARLNELSRHMESIAAQGGATGGALSDTLEQIISRIAASREVLSGTDAAVAELTDASVRLLEILQSSAQQSREDLPAAIAVAEERLNSVDERTREIGTFLAEATEKGAELSDYVLSARSNGAEALEQIEGLQARITEGNINQTEQVSALRSAVASLGEECDSLSKHAQAELVTAIEALKASAQSVVANIGESSSEAVHALAGKIAEESGEAVDRALKLRTAESIGQLEQAAAHASGVAREAALQLRDQLELVSQLASNLETRVEQAREKAEEQVDNDFARRMALITESLNSNAIDIAKAMSNEVTDTAWASYLRGDRGIFTRRAVRLLENSEAREIASIYEEDLDFREHVSRYIHDFENMLRTMLSTRDGKALAVTLLSSDMGKLYVALAQAIDRLRD